LNPEERSSSHSASSASSSASSATASSIAASGGAGRGRLLADAELASGRVISLCPPFVRPWCYTASGLQLAALCRHLAAHCGCHPDEIVLLCGRRRVTGKEHNLAFVEGTIFRHSGEAGAGSRGAPPGMEGPWIRLRYARRVTS
jgi:hypothetical protein